jgi:hypothetical protein
MADIAYNRNLAIFQENAGGVGRGLAKNATTFYAGTFVMLDISTGYINNAADTANFVWVGIVQRKVTGDTAASPVPEVTYITGPMTLQNYPVTGTSAVTHNGDLVYPSDNNTLTVSAASNIKAIGCIDKWLVGTSCDVRLFSPEVSRAQN